MEQDAFITSLPLPSYKTKKRANNDKLVNVRKDHAQLMDIVKKFGSKVSTMVDNQRMDYMVAYENHMLDVQKELYLLREKVQEIATDSTRDEKIKSLEAAQTKYKSESILLDEQNNEMRKKLRSLTVSMQSAERDRDWLLTRLRKAKKTYGALESECDLEKMKGLVDDSMYSNSLDRSVSQESSLLLGLYKSKKLQEEKAQGHGTQGHGQGTPGQLIAPQGSNMQGSNTGLGGTQGMQGSNMQGGNKPCLAPISRTGPFPPNKPVWKNRLAATVAVSRGDPFKDPFQGVKGGARTTERIDNNQNSSNNNSSDKNNRTNNQSERMGGTVNHSNIVPSSVMDLQHELNAFKEKRNQAERSKIDKKNVSLLVLLRERKKGMRELIEKCLQSCEGTELTGDLSAFNSLSELVLVCLESIEDNNAYKLNKNNGNNGGNGGNGSNKISENNLDVNSHDNYDNDTSNNGKNSNNSNKINDNRIDDSRDKSDSNDYDNSNNINYDNTMNNNDGNNNNNDNNNDNNNNNANGSAPVSSVEEDAVARATEEAEQRQWLGSLLAGHPETFMAILDILSGKYSAPSAPRHQDNTRGSDMNNNNNNDINNDIINNLANFDTTAWLNKTEDPKPLKSARSFKMKKDKSLRGIGGIRRSSSSSKNEKKNDLLVEERSGEINLSRNVPENVADKRDGEGGEGRGSSEDIGREDSNDVFNDSVCDERSEDGMSDEGDRELGVQRDDEGLDGEEEEGEEEDGEDDEDDEEDEVEPIEEGDEDAEEDFP